MHISRSVQKNAQRFYIAFTVTEYKVKKEESGILDVLWNKPT